MRSESGILRMIKMILPVCFILLCCAGCARQTAESDVRPVSEATEVVRESAEPDIRPASEAAEVVRESAAPSASPAPESPEKGAEDVADENGEKLAAGYVLVSSPTVTAWLPLPEKEDYVYPLKQVIAGGETLNMIHLTPDGVYMESSTCENQNCVEEGVVTLENRDSRILGNMIICLPNQVTLELYSAGELFTTSAGK